jgi:hypothetical protein
VAEDPCLPLRPSEVQRFDGYRLGVTTLPISSRGVTTSLSVPHDRRASSVRLSLLALAGCVTSHRSSRPAASNQPRGASRCSGRKLPRPCGPGMTLAELRLLQSMTIGRHHAVCPLARRSSSRGSSQGFRPLQHTKIGEATFDPPGFPHPATVRLQGFAPS